MDTANVNVGNNVHQERISQNAVLMDAIQESVSPVLFRAHRITAMIARVFITMLPEMLSRDGKIPVTETIIIITNRVMTSATIAWTTAPSSMLFRWQLLVVIFVRPMTIVSTITTNPSLLHFVWVHSNVNMVSARWIAVPMIATMTKRRITATIAMILMMILTIMLLMITITMIAATTSLLMLIIIQLLLKKVAVVSQFRSNPKPKLLRSKLQFHPKKIVVLLPVLPYQSVWPQSLHRRYFLKCFPLLLNSFEIN